MRGAQLNLQEEHKRVDHRRGRHRNGAQTRETQAGYGPKRKLEVRNEMKLKAESPEKLGKIPPWRRKVGKIDKYLLNNFVKLHNSSRSSIETDITIRNEIVKRRMRPIQGSFAYP